MACVRAAASFWLSAERVVAASACGTGARSRAAWRAVPGTRLATEAMAARRPNSRREMERFFESFMGPSAVMEWSGRLRLARLANPRSGINRSLANRFAGIIAGGLELFQVGVAFNEFLGAAAGEADGKAAVVFVPLDSHNRANAVFGVTNFTAKERVAIPGMPRRTAKGNGAGGGPPRSRRRESLRLLPANSA